MEDVNMQKDSDMMGHQQMTAAKYKPGGSNRIASKCNVTDATVKTVRRGPGRPKKTFNAIDNLLTVSKAIKKKVKPLKAISKLSFNNIISKQQNERDSGAKREIDESVCFAEKKKCKFDEQLIMSTGKKWEHRGNIDSSSYVIDTERLQNVVPVEAYSWPDEIKKQVGQESLSMPFLSVSDSFTLPTFTYKDSNSIEDLGKEPMDYIPLELNDPSVNVEVNSTKSSLPVENVYDVLCWHKEMEDMKPGNVISARVGMSSDLMFQFTLDAGHFLKEATGINIFVFTETSPSLTQKSPLVVFVQASNKDLIRIKCQNSDLNLSLPIKSKQNICQSYSPRDCSTQRLKQAEVRTYGESVNNLNLHHNNGSYCHIQDQRIQEMQSEWAHFVQSVGCQHPELLDEHFQPYVKLTKVQNLTWTYDGCLNSFHNQNSSGGSGGNNNNRCTYTRHKIERAKWSKATKTADQSARTGHIVKTYECCSNCPKHTIIHGQLTPPLYTCNSSKLEFLDIVYLLETMFWAEIKAVIQKHTQCWQPLKDRGLDIEGSRKVLLPGDKNCLRSSTDDFIPLSPVERKSKMFKVTENSSGIFLDENVKRTHCFEGFTKEDTQLIQKKVGKTSRLCSFILPKKTRKKKHLKFTTQDLSKCTLKKKEGFKIRLWQGFDKRLLQLKADRRKAASKPLLPSKKVNESHLCQLCQVAFPKLHSLNGHRSSMTHCRRVREKMATYCEVLGSIAGLEIDLKEESEATLEVVEVIEERVQVEDELGVTTQDDNASTFVTFVYQNPTLSTISKLLIGNNEKGEKDRVPLSRFLDSYCGESDDSFTHFGSNVGPLPEENALRDLPTERESSDALKLEGMQPRKRKNSYLLGICRDKKKAKGEWNIMPEGPNWLEEVQTSDLGAHELWYLRGQRKKREYQLGPVVHVKKYKKHTKKRNSPNVWSAFWPSLRKCVSEESPRTLGSVDSGISSCQSPYYPHPLLNCPEELYKETGNELGQVESTTKGTCEVQVPHELYEKHRYFRYVDLDRPTEFYYFDVDSEGNPVAVTDLSPINNNHDEIGTNSKFKFGENRKDSFLELLESLGEMREENERVSAGVPVFSCTAVPDVSQVSSNTLSTPVMTPDRAADSEENRFIDWTINRSETGFDCEFENLWNCT